MLEWLQRIASLSRTAAFLNRFRDAGDDGQFSERGVRVHSPVMHIRQLVFASSSFLNYPLRTNELTVLRSLFSCFLCVQ